MTTKEAENKNITGLELASDRKETEYDLTKALLEAAEYQEDEENICEFKVTKGKKLLFVVHFHPLSDSDLKMARKKATKYMPNPAGKKLPQIEKDFDSSQFKSWLIYLATTDEDQVKVWGNNAVMDKYDLMLPVESIDRLVPAGVKSRMVDEITAISGFDDEDTNVDEETFR